jgi:hypothetical protein
MVLVVLGSMRILDASSIAGLSAVAAVGMATFGLLNLPVIREMKRQGLR